MKNKTSNNDLYNLLEVSPRARPSVIHAAYRTLMKEYHPDMSKDNSKVAQRLTQAKEVLLDEEKRKEYDSDMENLEGKIIGNYRVIRKIAEGGFGITYQGEQIEINAPVCIKHAHYVSPQDQEILIEEAQSIWDLRHYGIPAMRDLIKMDDGSLALIMSYIEGPTLEQIVSSIKKMDPEDVSWITERSLNVLKYLHYHGVVHGDVKPQNIIIQPESHNIVLVDYGLANIKPSHFKKGSKGYTPYFASPEQESGGIILPESDFFGLGMTMIYALGGDIQKKQVPHSVPNELCSFIKRFIVKDVLSRPNWNKEDLSESIQDLRKKVFGRRHSDMKSIEGFFNNYTDERRSKVK